MKKKNYQFKIKTTCISFGTVSAKNEDEARRLITNEEWDDIIDTWGMEYGDIISIEES